MFVTNHVLSGVIVGRAFRRRPAVAFAAGVASHLVLDACPHWGCNTRVAGGSERFLRAARRDGVLGLGAMAVATLAVDGDDRAATVAAMVGAVLLDLDKPSIHFFGRDPFPRVVARLHLWMQNESDRWLPAEFAYGILFAVADAVIAVTGRRRNPSTAPMPLRPVV